MANKNSNRHHLNLDAVSESACSPPKILHFDIFSQNFKYYPQTDSILYLKRQKMFPSTIIKEHNDF